MLQGSDKLVTLAALMVSLMLSLMLSLATASLPGDFVGLIDGGQCHIATDKLTERQLRKTPVLIAHEK